MERNVSYLKKKGSTVGVRIGVGAGRAEAVAGRGAAALITRPVAVLPVRVIQICRLFARRGHQRAPIRRN